jgi:3-hydroxyisobutyrate dehydrogenase
MRVGWCGLGRMGAPMAMHVVRAGHDVAVWNRTPGRAADLVAAGAREVNSPAEAARDADVVVTMLFGPDAVREVLLGTDGIASGLPAGGLVVESSTIGPDVARELAATLAASNHRFVDAPVAGSVQPATDGTLGVLVGGAETDVTEARPLLELWGDPQRVRHLGPVGAGSAMKLVVNLTLGVTMGAVGEALRLAGDLGIERTAALDVLSTGPVGFTVGSKRALLESGNFTPTNFSVELMAKDLALAVDVGQRDLALTAAALAAARATIAAGHGDDDYSALAGHLASAEGA